MILRFSVIFVFFSMNLWASSNELSFSAKTAALGGASLSSQGEISSVFDNPAGLAYIDQLGIQSNYTSPFHLSDLKSGNVIFGGPWKNKSGWGFSYGQFQHPLFQERDARFSYGTRFFSWVSVGSSIQLHRLRIDRYEDSSDWGVKLGVIGELTPQMIVAVTAQEKAHPDPSVKSLSKYRLGISFRPTERVYSYVDVKQTSRRETVFRFGQEIVFSSYFKGYAGIQERPQRYSLGCGIILSSLEMDFAYLIHPILGEQYVYSLTWRWGKKRKLLKREESKTTDVRLPPKKNARVHINTAGPKEWMSLPGIGSVKTLNILHYRLENGNFKKKEDLLKVPGINPSLLKSLDALIYIDLDVEK